jgi:cell division protein FtsW
MATRSGAIRAGIKRSTAAARPSVTSGISHPASLVALTTGALLFLGLVMILSASSVTSFAQYGSSFLFFKKQLLWAVVGVIGFFACSKLDYHRLRGVGYLLLIGSAALLVIVLVPGAGVMVGGSARWLRLGPLSFQPSEFAKLALILFSADVYSRKKESWFSEWSHTMVPMVPILCILGLLVMLQPDMGTTVVLGAIGLSMLFIAGAPMGQLIPIGALGAGAATLLALAEPYRKARLLAFLNPFADPYNTGYQTVQSLIGIGSGGLFGVGLGASRQKWSYIPNAHTDYIFAILGEEMGLIGTMAVLGLFAFLVYLCIRIARKAPDRFGMLLACGIGVWIGFQALVNMGAVTASLPVTGVPLPLVSFGGSSLVASLMALGILRNIAAQGRR